MITCIHGYSLVPRPAERWSGKLLTFLLALGLECQTANQIQAKAIKLQSHMTTELLISDGLQCVCTCTKIERPSPRDWTAIDGAITGAITRLN